MSKEQRVHKRYSVTWQGHLLQPDGSVSDMKVKDISKGGISIFFEHALPMRSQIKMEFFTIFRNKKVRFRIVGFVVHNQILSNNEGVHVGMKYAYFPSDEMHTLSNIFMEFEERGQY